MNLLSRGLAIAGVGLFAACASTPEAGPPPPPPELTSQELNLRQSLTDFQLTFTGQLESEQPATIEKANWEMVVEGNVVKSGEQPLNIEVTPGQPASFTLEANGSYVGSAEELKAMSERGGSLLTALRGDLLVRQGQATHKIPFARSREVRTPRLPTVRMGDLYPARYSDDEANITFYLRVMNPNPFPLRIQDLGYKIVVADKQIADGTRARGDAIDPAAMGEFDIQVSINKETMGPDVRKLIKSATLPYKVEGELKGELFTVPYSLDGVVRLSSSQ